MNLILHFGNIEKKEMNFTDEEWALIEEKYNEFKDTLTIKKYLKMVLEIGFIKSKLTIQELELKREGGNKFDS